MIVTSEQCRFVLEAMLREASRDGLTSIEVNSGVLHRTMGGYPGPNHRMPIVCQAMRSEMSPSHGDVVVSQPAKGKGASLTILYSLPR